MPPSVSLCLSVYFLVSCTGLYCTTICLSLFVSILPGILHWPLLCHHLSLFVCQYTSWYPALASTVPPSVSLCLSVYFLVSCTGLYCATICLSLFVSILPDILHWPLLCHHLSLFVCQYTSWHPTLASTVPPSVSLCLSVYFLTSCTGLYCATICLSLFVSILPGILHWPLLCHHLSLFVCQYTSWYPALACTVPPSVSLCLSVYFLVSCTGLYCATICLSLFVSILPDILHWPLLCHHLSLFVCQYTSWHPTLASTVPPSVSLCLSGYFLTSCTGLYCATICLSLFVSVLPGILHWPLLCHHLSLFVCQYTSWYPALASTVPPSVSLCLSEYFLISCSSLCFTLTCFSLFIWILP